MIGIVIVTHDKLGEALIEAATSIVGNKPDSLLSVSINPKEKADTLRSKIEKSIKKVDQGNGVLILTDMFGGTPSNLSYSFLEEGKIEVISGVNLPVVFKSVDLREKMDLATLASTVENFGKRSISLASGILKGNKRSS